MAKPFRACSLLRPILILGAGCATLPDVSATIRQAPANGETPQIESAKGPLSLTQSTALMERLKRSVSATEMLQRSNTVIESVSESPLTKGNKVTLLVDGPATYAVFATLLFKQTHG